MKELLDTNTWIALCLETHPQHPVARGWYEAAPLTSGDLLFCRATEISFLRLLTQEQKQPIAKDAAAGVRRGGRRGCCTPSATSR
jgi:predicted nucleic acid-binding protein